MYIQELFAGQNITIQVIINAEQLEFSTTVLEPVPKKHGIYAAPIFKNEKVLSFRGSGILTHLIASFPDSKPHIFYNVIIQTMKADDNSYSYLITCLSPSREFNRRGAYRCFIGVPSSVQIGLNSVAMDTVIKDVSLTGFSFVLENPDKEFTAGSTVHVLLNDFIEEKMERFSFHLYGIIVRKIELENNKTVYGCRMTAKVRGLDKYIMMKERIQLNKSRGAH